MEIQDYEKSAKALLTGQIKKTPSLHKPYGVGARYGRLYITDLETKSVQVYDVPRRKFYRIGYRQGGKLIRPTGIAVDGKSNVYVMDSAAKKVMVYDFMPGSGGYDSAQKTTVSTTFLDGWDNPNSWLQGGFGPACGNSPCHHSALGTEGNTGEQPGDCMECHNKDNSFGLPEFSVFIIGKNLQNDHPIGVKYPDPGVYDFNPGMVTAGGFAYFDANGYSHPDNNELRLYDEGDGPQVECATCHDPHGVRSAGEGSLLIPSFLRVKSNDSAICLTCHTKQARREHHIQLGTTPSIDARHGRPIALIAQVRTWLSNARPC